MIKNYFKVSMRFILNNRMFALINISGLSIGLACCLLLFLYVIEENSYDKHHGGDTYRLISHMSIMEEQKMSVATSSVPIGPVIKADIPDIMESARILPLSIMGDKNIIKHGDKILYLEDGFTADSALFNILNYRFIEGNPDHALREANNIVLKKELAYNLFGREIALGKMVRLKTIFGEAEFMVSGVIDDGFYQTHFKPSFIAPMHHAGWKPLIQSMNNWVGNNLVYTYLKLLPGADAKIVEGKIDELFQINGKEDLAILGATKYMELQPVEEIHFDTSLTANFPGNTSKLYVKVITSIGILVLILACVNYVNLSTAQAGKRAMEVGVRKAMGASPFVLGKQFLAESFMLVFISVLFCILLAELAMPWFNQLLGANLSVDFKNWGLIGLLLLAFLLITSLLAGAYPAFIMSSFDPLKALKGRLTDRGSIGVGKKVFVVFQFVISVSLISSIIIISDQFSFISKKDKGYNSAFKLVLPLTGEEDQMKYETLKNEITGVPGVKAVTGTSFVPGEYIVTDIALYAQGKSMEEAVIAFRTEIDDNWLETMEIQIIAGRNFHADSKADTEGRIIVNRVLAEQLGYQVSEIVGENLFFDFEEMRLVFEVIGVMDDIHHLSLHNDLKGMVYQLDSTNTFSKLVVALNPGAYPTVVDQIEVDWNKQMPDAPFESVLLDDILVKQYEKDEASFNIIMYFAILSILISCMGLYALSVFVAERKFKEIGIRKTFGATISDIIVMVSADLSLLIVISFTISIPLTYFAAREWLDTFSYHIEPGLWAFVLSGLITVTIAWLTMGYQSLKAARTNPVDVIKDE